MIKGDVYSPLKILLKSKNKRYDKQEKGKRQTTPKQYQFQGADEFIRQTVTQPIIIKITGTDDINNIKILLNINKLVI